MTQKLIRIILFKAYGGFKGKFWSYINSATSGQFFGASPNVL